MRSAIVVSLPVEIVSLKYAASSFSFYLIYLRIGSMKFCLTSLYLLITAVSVPAIAAPPNLVLIFTDDQRADAVGYSGNHAVSTPHLDALAREGLVFQNCFVNTSICAVSRANIISGQYPDRHGVKDFFAVLSPEQLDQSVPGLLQQAGYQTAFFGKWGIGDSVASTAKGAAVFDYWAGQPMQTSFYHEPDCNFVNHDGFTGPEGGLCDCPPDSRGVKGFHNRIGKANLTDPLHADADVIPAQVARFLEGRDPSKPFALFLFFKSPHSPFPDWDDEVQHVTDHLVMPTPPGATIALAKQEPDAIKKSLGRPSGMRYLNDPAFLDQHLRDYYRLVSSMDLGVGRINDHLAEHDVAPQTVTLFTSDNGHFKGEHGLAGKWLMYEPSLRVPGFLHDPRNLRATVTTRPVITTDFSVTMLALAGVSETHHMTGRDLSALLENPAADWRDDLYYDHPYGHDGAIPRTVGIRNTRYSYIRYIDTDPADEQLFDLLRDPLQIHNLVDDAGHQDILIALRERCDELQKDVGPR